MITIQDWIAVIPEEDKHIAFVGEHQAVTRTFLLTGKDWRTYEEWGFHLDMAFDLSSVTSRAERNLETTQVSTTENVSDTVVKTTGNTTKEKYTVTEVEVDCMDKTDIATLKKRVVEDGIQLTWTVLRQHTQLPGKLKATLRALGHDGEIKKSDLMVFEVEPAVVAEAAADIPQSEFEAMEEHMDEMLTAVLRNTITVEGALEKVESAMVTLEDTEAHIDDVYNQIDTLHYEAYGYKNRAEEYANTARKEAERVLTDWPTADEGFDLTYGNNRLNPHQVVHNKGQLANGLVGNDSTKQLSLTGYIQVQEGEVLSYQRTDPDTGERVYGSLYAVCLFDENKAVNFEANQYQANEDGRLHEITIPAGVSYVRLTLHYLDTAVDPAIAPCHALIPYEAFCVERKLKATAYDATRLDTAAQPVRYTEQTLTEEQKAQARANIGVAEPLTVDSDLNIDSLNPVQNRVVAGRINVIDQAIDTSLQEIDQLRQNTQYAISTAVNLGQKTEKMETSLNQIGTLAQQVNTRAAFLEERITALETTMGEVDVALDHILTLQETLIGGACV